MTINVTQKHIDAGRAAMAGGGLPSVSCAITQAVREIWPKATTGASFMHQMDEERTAYFLPESARTFIKSFDNGVPVAPFSFELEELYDENN